jgi:hypothetical protein
VDISFEVGLNTVLSIDIRSVYCQSGSGKKGTVFFFHCYFSVRMCEGILFAAASNNDQCQSCRINSRYFLFIIVKRILFPRTQQHRLCIYMLSADTKSF